MKYLKLFESLNYYTKIGGSEFYDKFFVSEEEADIINTPFVEISSCAGYFNTESIDQFSIIEISKIEELFRYLGSYEVKKIYTRDLDDTWKKDIKKIKIKNSILQVIKSELRSSKRDPYIDEWRDVVYFDIFKSVDDWYYVYKYGINEEFYKCDQIDGLAKFIEDTFKRSKDFSDRWIEKMKANTSSKKNESKDLGFINKQSRSLGEKFTINNTQKFKDKDIDKIKSLLEPYDVTDFEIKLPSKGTKIRSLVHSIGFWMPYKDIKSTRKYISIESFKDEWFLVGDYPHYYECDQIEGVINCLKALLPEDYIKESNSYYFFKEIGRREYFNYLEDDKIYCFANEEISKINSVIEVTPIGANIETSYGGFIIYDQFDLSSCISSNKIEVNFSDGNKMSFYSSNEEESEYLTDLLNYTLVILEDKTSDNKSSIKTFINKLEEEWYIVEHGGDIKKFYKCDQVDGLIELLKSLYSIKESFQLKEKYKEINLDEFNYDLWGEETGDEITDEKISKETVKEKWDYFTKYEFERIGGLGLKFIKDEKTYSKPILSYISDKEIITIYKLIDDWFYIFYSTQYRYWESKMYKCDQINGLIECLKMIINKDIHPLKGIIMK